jgi:hypothetical protein
MFVGLRELRSNGAIRGYHIWENKQYPENNLKN